jgi:hypothetical protein
MDRRSFVALRSRLEKVKTDLEVLTENVKKYDEFWSSLKMDFGSLETVIPQVSPDGSNPLRTYSVRRRLVQAQSQLARYARRVIQVPISLTSFTYE